MKRVCFFAILLLTVIACWPSPTANNNLEVDSICKQSEILFKSGRYNEAIASQINAVETCGTTYGKKNKKYANAVNDLAKYYLYQGNLNKAIQYINEALHLEETLSGINSIDYAKTLTLLSNYNWQLQFYDKSHTQAQKAAEIIEKGAGKDNDNYADAIELLSCWYHQSNDMQKATQLEEEVRNIHAKLHGNESPEYAIDLVNLASLSSDPDKALQMCNEALSIEKKNNHENHPDYANTLHCLSAIYLQKKNYDLSIQYDYEALQIIKNTIGTDNLNYAFILQQESYCKFYSGNIQDAIDLAYQSLQIIEKISDKKSELHLSLLNGLATLMANTKDVDKSIELAKQALNIIQERDGTESLSYAQQMTNVAEFYAESGDNKKALEIGNIALSNIIKYGGKSCMSYATTLNNLANSYGALGYTEKAIQYDEESLKLTEQLLGKESYEYVNTLSNLAELYLNNNNLQKCLDSATKALELKKKSEDTPGYAKTLACVACCYSKTRKFDLANKTFEQSLSMTEQAMGKNSQQYCDILLEQAESIFEQGRIDDALNKYSSAAQTIKDTFGEDYLEYAQCMSCIGGCYAQKYNYRKAIEFSRKALPVESRLLGTNSPGYLSELSNLAAYLSGANNRTEALETADEAWRIYTNIHNNDKKVDISPVRNISAVYAQTGNYLKAIDMVNEALKSIDKTPENEVLSASLLSLLASYHFEIGNLSEAFQLELQAAKIRGKADDASDAEKSNSASSMASFMARLGKLKEAIQLEELSLQLNEKFFGKNSVEYARSIDNLALYNERLGNTFKADSLENQAMTIMEHTIGKNTIQYANLLINLANFNLQAGKYYKSLELRNQALQTYKEFYDENHPHYIYLLSELSFNHFLMQQYKETEKYALGTSELLYNMIVSNFSSMTSQERQFFWEKYHNWYTSTLPLYCYTINDETLCDAAYDGQLLSKSILLSTEIQLKDILLESGNKDIINEFNSLQGHKQTLNKLYDQPDKERKVNIDSLNNIIRFEEKDLQNKSTLYGDYTKNLKVHWRDVQSKLNDNSIAIEFVSFNTKSDVIYAALILKKQFPHPKMIKLFSQKEIDQIGKNEYYTTDKLSKLIWSPLSEHLNPGMNIYFSPTGLLYQIAIEHLPLTDGTNIADKYKLYRISSTRELAIEHQNTFGGKAVLYGGLDYEFGQADWTASKHLLDTISDNQLIAFRDVPVFDLRKIRAGVNFLEGSSKEVDKVEELLRADKIPTAKFKGLMGTEETFKRLSGKKVSIIHIATHGYYQMKDTVLPIEKGRDTLQIVQNYLSYISNQPIDEMVLSWSGLFFSGVKTILNNEKVPEGMDDGILTAKEISHIDLRGLDLVVLSACETGMGEISSEGVFGLQRGFKKAGAQTIVMSLWKVNDDATQILMQQFYKNLTEGKSKRESFVNAQNYLRTYDNGRYNKPEYWAAFIMLDGIN